MASFIESIKTLGQKQLTPEEQALQALKKEIEGMQLKKTSLMAALDKEIDGIRGEIDGVFREIGKKLYESQDDKDTKPDFEPSFKTIKDFEASIAEKEEKKAEFEARYDEEINILEKNLEQSRQKMAEPTPQGTFFCEKCGTPYTPGQIVFCGKCGNKLS